MDITEFQERGAEIIDYIVDYLESVSERRVAPEVYPNYLQHLLPLTAPNDGESFETIVEDVEKYIIPGLTHWQHRRFHSYFPANTSFPSILAEMISDGMGCVGFDWNTSPSGIELEKIVLDWLGKMIGLPNKFLHYSSGSIGGAFIHNTASECVFISIINARRDVLEKLKQKNESLCEAALLSSLVAYCSRESHSCIEKAAMILMVTIKVLETDDTFRLRGETLANAIKSDKEHGLIPFYAAITIGTTSCCSCDPIDEIGPVCDSEGIWLHVDGAYAGSAMICPEFRPLLKGIEYASSFDINPVKWLLVNLDCSVLWIKDRLRAEELSIIDKTLLYHTFEKDGVHTSRSRFRALKLWFVIRSYGVEGLQEYMRNHVRLAKMFADLVRGDERFELITSQFGLVCFRLKGSNILNKKLLMSINSSAKLHITACRLNSKYVIRFCVCVEHANEGDIVYAWSVFCDFASVLLQRKNRKSSLL